MEILECIQAGKNVLEVSRLWEMGNTSRETKMEKYKAERPAYKAARLF